MNLVTIHTLLSAATKPAAAYSGSHLPTAALIAASVALAVAVGNAL
jgi:hypothetical protein